MNVSHLSHYRSAGFGHVMVARALCATSLSSFTTVQMLSCVCLPALCCSRGSILDVLCIVHCIVLMQLMRATCIVCYSGHVHLTMG